MRSLLWARISSAFDSAPTPQIPPPFDSMGTGLAVVPLLRTTLASIDPLFMRNAIRSSFKRAVLPGFRRVKVPQEAVYQSELERILRSWLPADVKVIPQSNAGGRKRSDIILVPDEEHKILLELVASQPIADIINHFGYEFLRFDCFMLLFHDDLFVDGLASMVNTLIFRKFGLFISR